MYLINQTTKFEFIFLRQKCYNFVVRSTRYLKNLWTQLPKTIREREVACSPVSAVLFIIIYLYFFKILVLVHGVSRLPKPTPMEVFPQTAHTFTTWPHNTVMYSVIL